MKKEADIHHPITGTVIDGMTQAEMFECSNTITGSTSLGELWVASIHAAIEPKPHRKNLGYWTAHIKRYCEAVKMQHSSDARTRELGNMLRKESASFFPNILK